ncbi:hypothetical protein BGW80DRAFT_1256840 [Lactifluus volemus]|nr:hypothetical protein BGW80DRAFT_1256840 [Lactifluus volemus]
MVEATIRDFQYLSKVDDVGKDIRHGLGTTVLPESRGPSVKLSVPHKYRTPYKGPSVLGNQFTPLQAPADLRLYRRTMEKCGSYDPNYLENSSSELDARTADEGQNLPVGLPSGGDSRTFVVPIHLKWFTGMALQWHRIGHTVITSFAQMFGTID